MIRMWAYPTLGACAASRAKSVRCAGDSQARAPSATLLARGWQPPCIAAVPVASALAVASRAVHAVQIFR